MTVLMKSCWGKRTQTIVLYWHWLYFLRSGLGEVKAGQVSGCPSLHLRCYFSCRRWPVLVDKEVGRADVTEFVGVLMRTAFQKSLMSEAAAMPLYG